MKKEGAAVLAILTTLSFVSAYSPNFGNFGFSNIFSSFNVSLYLIALVFVTIFGVVYFILGRSPFRDNNAIKLIISLCVTSFALWGILSSGFSFESFLYNIGIDSDILPTVLWMAAVVVAIALIAKFKFKGFFAIVFGLAGATLIVLSVIGVFYKGGAGIIIGLVFLSIFFILRKSLKHQKKFKQLTLDKQMDYKTKRAAYKKFRRDLEKEKLEKWNSAGQRMGYYAAKMHHKFKRKP